MKQTLMLVMSVFVSACGTPCSRIAAAEAAANNKGSACNSSSSNWDSAHVTRCEAGLSKCSADDQKWLDTYADCLQKLPSCAQGQGTSWNLQRIACTEPLFSVSGTCANAVK